MRGRTAWVAALGAGITVSRLVLSGNVWLAVAVPAGTVLVFLLLSMLGPRYVQRALQEAKAEGWPWNEYVGLMGDAPFKLGLTRRRGQANGLGGILSSNGTSVMWRSSVPRVKPFRFERTDVVASSWAVQAIGFRSVEVLSLTLADGREVLLWSKAGRQAFEQALVAGGLGSWIESATR